MQPIARQPYAVYLFSDEGPGKVFARFATKQEAESFCRDWQKFDPANLYAVDSEFI